jgi:hypothetical protein
MNPRSTSPSSRPQAAWIATQPGREAAPTRRATARKLGLLAWAALAASAAQAADSYVGLGLGSGRQDLTCATGQACDRTSTGSFKAFLGVEPTENLGVEAMAWRLGTAQGRVAQGAGLVAARTRSEGLALTGVARTQFDAWTLRAKLGVGYVTGKADLAGGSRVKSSHWAPVGGLGVSYALDKRWALNADWDRLPTRYTSSTKAAGDLYSVGLSYRF